MNRSTNISNLQVNQQQINSNFESASVNISLNNTQQNLSQYLFPNISSSNIPTLQGFSNSESIALSGFIVFQNVAKTVSKLQKTITKLQRRIEELSKKEQKLNDQNATLKQTQKQLIKQNAHLQKRYNQIVELNARFDRQSFQLYNLNVSLNEEIDRIREISKSFHEKSMNNEEKQSINQYKKLFESINMSFQMQNNQSKAQQLVKLSSVKQKPKILNQSQVLAKLHQEHQDKQAIIKSLFNQIKMLNLKNQNLHNLLYDQSFIAVGEGFQNSEIIRLSLSSQ